VHEVKCNVFQCKTFSSHADTNELQTIIHSIKPELTHLVHGEMTSKLILQNFIL
jgi:predicted metal-dependent RNase